MGIQLKKEIWTVHEKTKSALSSLAWATLSLCGWQIGKQFFTRPMDAWVVVIASIQGLLCLLVIVSEIKSRKIILTKEAEKLSNGKNTKLPTV